MFHLVPQPMSETWSTPAPAGGVTITRLDQHQNIRDSQLPGQSFDIRHNLQALTPSPERRHGSATADASLRSLCTREADLNFNVSLQGRGMPSIFAFSPVQQPMRECVSVT